MTTRVTQATAIAAIEAARNERQTLAAAALAGERRAAWARLAMIALFAFTMEILPALGGYARPFNVVRFAVGFVYTSLAIVTVLALRRAKPDPGRARVRPRYSARAWA